MADRSFALPIHLRGNVYLKGIRHRLPPCSLFDQTFNNTRRLLPKHNIKTVGLPPRKVAVFLWPVKDDPGLKSLGVYNILYECGKVYTGEIERCVDTKIKEHNRRI
jgi:hypothetical protein